MAPPIPAVAPAAAPAAAAYPPPAGAPGRPLAPADWQRSLPAPFNAIPAAVVVVCALMAFAGVLVLWPVLAALPETLELLGQGGLAFQIGLLVLTLWVVLGLFGAALLVLAWRLAHADRVARALTYVLCATLGLSILFGDEQSGQLTLVMLACFGTLAALGLAPNVRGFFTGGDAPQSGQPVALVVARTLVAVWAACITLVGATFLPLGGLGAKFVLVGIAMLALGIGAFYLNGRLAERDRRARVIISWGALLYGVLTLIIGRRDPGMLIPLGIVVGVTWNLWLPREAKVHFGDPVPALDSEAPVTAKVQ
jgi:hypothetical protein